MMKTMNERVEEVLGLDLGNTYNSIQVLEEALKFYKKKDIVNSIMKQHKILIEQMQDVMRTYYSVEDGELRKDLVNERKCMLVVSDGLRRPSRRLYRYIFCMGDYDETLRMANIIAEDMYEYGCTFETIKIKDANRMFKEKKAEFERNYNVKL